MQNLQPTNRVYLWRQGQSVYDLFVCPIQQPNHQFTVAIFDPTGHEWVFSNSGYETAKLAIRAGVRQAFQMTATMTELGLVQQLQEAGLISSQEMNNVEQRVWKWCQIGD